MLLTALQAVALLAGMDVIGCIGCDLFAGRRGLPGIVRQSGSCAVNHVVGPMNLGTLVVGLQEHLTAIANLTGRAAAELG